MLHKIVVITLVSVLTIKVLKTMLALMLTIVMVKMVTAVVMVFNGDCGVVVSLTTCRKPSQRREARNGMPEAWCTCCPSTRASEPLLDIG